VVPGLQIIAEADVHDVGYWDAHPLVERAIGEIDRADPDTMVIRLALKPLAAAVPVRGAPASAWAGPSRAPDLELYGRGSPYADFWTRCPRLEHLELFHEPSSPAVPEGWWVARLWLESPPTAAG
jgi:hypothetical protein